MVKYESIQRLGLPRTIVSDNAITFMARADQDYGKDKVDTWTPVLAYATMSNVRAENFFGTIKYSIAEIISDTMQEWDQARRKALYGYRRQ